MPSRNPSQTDPGAHRKSSRDRTRSPSSLACSFLTPARGASSTFGSGQLPLERSDGRNPSENSVSRELSGGHRRTTGRLPLSVSGLSMRTCSSNRSILDVRGRKSLQSIASAMLPGSGWPGVSDGSPATGGGAHRQRHGLGDKGRSPSRRERGGFDARRCSHFARRSASDTDSIRNARSGDSGSADFGRAAPGGPRSVPIARLEDSFVTETGDSRETSLANYARRTPDLASASPVVPGVTRSSFSSPLARSATAPTRHSCDASRPPLAAITSSLSVETLERSGDCGTSVSRGIGSISDESDYGGLGGDGGPAAQLDRISSVPVMSEESYEAEQVAQASSPAPASQPAAVAAATHESARSTDEASSSTRPSEEWSISNPPPLGIRRQACDSHGEPRAKVSEPTSLGPMSPAAEREAAMRRADSAPNEGLLPLQLDSPSRQTG